MLTLSLLGYNLKLDLQLELQKFMGYVNPIPAGV